MAPFIYNLLIFSTLFSSAFTSPTLESHNSLRRAKPSYSYKERQDGPFRRFRDSIVEKIWSLPSKPVQQSFTPSNPIRLPENFKARYGNEVVLRFDVRTEDEAKALSKAAQDLYLDIWEATDDWVDIRIAKDIIPPFLDLLPSTVHVSYRPLMHDLARAIYDTYPDRPYSEDHSIESRLTTPYSRSTCAGPPQDLFFQDYQPLSVLYPWLRLIASLFPAHATLISIGQSAEGRDIPALKLGRRSDNNGDPHTKRRTLLVVGGSHAREWIAISTTAFVAYNLVTRYGHPQYSTVTKLLNHFDVVFVPVLNPDGYEYTWTTDRLWRKNRQSTSLPFCPGIDLDRSFGFGWDGHGDSTNACSDDYPGPRPLAATEAQILTDWARNETRDNDVEFVSYLDFHSYSQEILYPFSYTCDVNPPNLEDLEEVAMGIAKSFRLTNGRYYGVESACSGSITFRDKVKKTRVQLESQGGSALDFFYHDLDVKLAFQVKLRDTGTYGFLLPKSNIVPTGEEAYEAVMGLGRWLLGNHGIEGIHQSESVWGEETTVENDASVQVDQDEEDADFYEPDYDLRRRRRR
ncbi:zinc carboxypeptidase [Exophiala viscosa]|uniref:Inactive metallocarboxypeptidase ECM14 n=1 Tax=Exophiala viscosa TaxID=2486360 RepID=A0AAN6DQU7_9EURO|nr:zinc carboxypeptidase [Exophiala viscosa]KAI1619699.1 zinc carboxypeptidase [Exophiala viscosa]